MGRFSSKSKGHELKYKMPEWTGKSRDHNKGRTHRSDPADIAQHHSQNESSQPGLCNQTPLPVEPLTRDSSENPQVQSALTDTLQQSEPRLALCTEPDLKLPLHQLILSEATALNNNCQQLQPHCPTPADSSASVRSTGRCEKPAFPPVEQHCAAMNPLMAK